MSQRHTQAIERVMAIDPALTCTGWALLSVETGGPLALGRMKALPAHVPLARRLEDIQRRVDLLFRQLRLGSADVLLCEAPTTMRDPSAAHKIEQVRGVYETLARSRSVGVPGRINPRSVQFELLGLRGPQIGREHVKHIALGVATHLHGEALAALGFSTVPANLERCQDVIDALLVGTLAVERVRSAVRAGMAVDEYLETLTVKQRTRRAVI